MNSNCINWTARARQKISARPAKTSDLQDNLVRQHRLELRRAYSGRGCRVDDDGIVVVGKHDRIGAGIHLAADHAVLSDIRRACR